MSPLAVASHQGHLYIVRILLENGANINLTDLYGKKAL